MKRLRARMGWFVVALVLAVAKPADAAQVGLGLGANYWFDIGALFDVTLSATGRVARNISVGGRFGAFLATEPETIGVPLDLLLRVNIDQLYIDALAGPWIRFEDDPLLGHFAIGFGLQSGNLSAGLEMGYLDPEPILGFKLGIRF